MTYPSALIDGREIGSCGFEQLLQCLAESHRREVAELRAELRRRPEAYLYQREVAELRAEIARLQKARDVSESGATPGSLTLDSTVTLTENAGPAEAAPAATVPHAVVSIFSPVDSEGSDQITVAAHPSAGTLLSPLLPGVSPSTSSLIWEHDPQDVFQSYCGAGRDDLDGKSFAKLCKDCDFLDRKFTAVDPDIIFATVVHKGQRRIDVEQFKAALRLIAEKKGVDLAEILKKLVEVRGPQLHGTIAENCRLYRQSAQDSQAYSTKRLSTSGAGSRSTSPNPDAMRARQQESGQLQPGRPSMATKRSTSKDSKESSPKPSPDVSNQYRLPSPSVSGMYRDTFRAFCGTQPDMDGKGFAKLCKDCQILDKKFTCTDVDVLFAKVVNKGQRRINLRQFEEAVFQVAEKKGIEANDVFGQIGRSGPPVFSGTQSDAVRFYYDAGLPRQPSVRHNPGDLQAQ